MFYTQKGIPRQGLRRIASTLHLVQSNQKLSFWLLELANWDCRHHEFVREKTVNTITGKYWYKHKLLRRSFSVLKSALHNIFAYLDNPRIPKSTDGLKSFFGHLKTNLNIHRGLLTGNRKSFLRWYLYFKKPEEKAFFSHKKRSMKHEKRAPKNEVPSFNLADLIAVKLFLSRAYVLFKPARDSKKFSDQSRQLFLTTLT